MKKSDLEKYKAVLVEKQKILLGDFQGMEESILNKSRLDSTGDITNIPTHLADASADTFEKDVMLGLIENKGEVLKAIEFALKKLEDGTYGICEGCSKKISKKRLNYIPYTKLCIKCKTLEEQGKSYW